jgi:hypothetical protein
MATRIAPPQEPPVLPGALYVRWRAAEPYVLMNLMNATESWPALPLDELELLALDQCLVFGASYPGSPAFVEWAARRDRVVRRSRDRLFAAYACVTTKLEPARRIALMHEVAHAVEQGAGSPAALLPFTHWDHDDTVRAAALERASLPLAVPLV